MNSAAPSFGPSAEYARMEAMDNTTVYVRAGVCLKTPSPSSSVQLTCGAQKAYNYCNGDCSSCQAAPGGNSTFTCVNLGAAYEQCVKKVEARSGKSADGCNSCSCMPDGSEVCTTKACVNSAGVSPHAQNVGLLASVLALALALF